jgi:hypothetical protein
VFIQQYPKWLYHASEPACIVNDPIEHDAKGPGWFDSPVAAKEYVAPPPVVDLPIECEAVSTGTLVVNFGDAQETKASAEAVLSKKPKARK